MDPSLTLPDLLRSTSPDGDEAAALLAPGRPPLSQAALRRQMAATAATLRRAGIGRTDRVAVILPNGPELAALSLAIASSATCAPLNPTFGDAELRFYLSDLQPAALLLAASNRSRARTIAASLGVRCLDVAGESDAPAGTYTLAIDSTPDPADRTPGASTSLRDLHTSLRDLHTSLRDLHTSLRDLHPPLRDLHTSLRDLHTSLWDPPAPDDVALLLHTSGTTSRPKLVPLTHRNLCVSAMNVIRTLELSPADRSLNLMPLFHIHGFVASLLASLAAGGSVACCAGYRDGRFVPWLDELRPTWYTATPAIHQAVLAELARQPEGAAAKRVRFARSASAPLPAALMCALESALQAPVIEAYGMTEAAHQIASNPLPPGKRRAKSVGLPAGTSVAIMDDAQRLLPTGATGEIVIRGDNVTAGYASPREANAEAFAAGWFRTGDLGSIDDAGYVRITGRLKELVNRAGEKISPAEVDAALLEHPDVRMAAAFGVLHPTMGEDIAAAVVLKEGAAASATQIRTFLLGRLTEFKIPSQLVVVDEIPVSPTGKIARAELSTLLAAQLRPAFVAPRDDAERKMAELFAEVLGASQVGAFDNFFALGGDSLRGVQLLSRIREHWQIDVPILELFKGPTLAQLAAATTNARRIGERAALEALLSEVERMPDAEAARVLLSGKHGG